MSVVASFSTVYALLLGCEGSLEKHQHDCRTELRRVGEVHPHRANLPTAHKGESEQEEAHLGSQLFFQISPLLKNIYGLLCFIVKTQYMDLESQNT